MTTTTRTICHSHAAPSVPRKPCAQPSHQSRHRHPRQRSLLLASLTTACLPPVSTACLARRHASLQSLLHASRDGMLPDDSRPFHSWPPHASTVSSPPPSVPRPTRRPAGQRSTRRRAPPPLRPSLLTSITCPASQRLSVPSGCEVSDAPVKLCSTHGRPVPPSRPPCCLLLPPRSSASSAAASRTTRPATARPARLRAHARRAPYRCESGRTSIWRPRRKLSLKS